MENNNHAQNSGASNDFLDDILGAHNVPKELGANEIAEAATNLTQQEDADLERIVQETMAENWGDENTSPSE